MDVPAMMLDSFFLWMRSAFACEWLVGHLVAFHVAIPSDRRPSLNRSLPEGVRRTVLPNGTTVLSESMNGQRSASVGVWIGLGSRHDPAGKAGLAHLYEHMVFKGTDRRSAVQVSRELEQVGGHLNAFTSREQTCFYAKVLDRDLPRAVDLLTDLVTGARLSGADLSKERQVVLEEIRSCDDDPDELVGDLFAQALWARHPLGEPIAGTVDSVKPLSVSDLRGHKARSLSSEVPFVVCAAGAVDHEQLVTIAERGLQRKAFGSPSIQKALRPGRRQEARKIVARDVSQVNLILARRSISSDHPLRHALGLVNLVLGGGMASRLNQELRERHGLAYSIYSFSDFMVGAGALGVSLGTEPSKARNAVDLVGREIRKLRERGLTRKDLRFAKDYAAGSAVLALESPSARMQHLGKCQLLYGRPLGLEEILHTVEAVTQDQIAEVIDSEFPQICEENGWTLTAVVPEGFSETLLW